MVLREMGYDAIAPHSETSMIKEDIITSLVRKYRKIIVLFDNDSAGKKGALLYNEKYGFQTIFLDLSKDISDCVLEHGFQESKAHLKNKIKECI
jgi:DNA primase